MLNNNDNDTLKAIICCLAAHFLFVIMATGVKYLAGIYHVAEIAFYRNIFILLGFLIFIISTKKTHLFKTKKPKLIAFRSLLSGFGVLATFAALSRLPMSYYTVLFFTSSLLTPALAFFFLKEKVGIHRWTAVLIGMCGVIIVAQPSGAVSIIGLLLALAAAGIHSVMFTSLRGLKTESPITITFYFVIAGMLVPALFMPWVAKGLSFDTLWIILMIAGTSGIGQILLSYAYKYADASLVTPFIYTTLFWTIIIDVNFWKYDLEFEYIIMGASLIMGAQFYIIFREYLNKRKRSMAIK